VFVFFEANEENLKYSDDDLLVAVARVTEGERRLGRLLDLDLKRYSNRKLNAENNKLIHAYEQ
jgi:hypothetical protein